LQAAAGLADEPAACECRSPSACLPPDRRYGRCRYELRRCPSEECRKLEGVFAPWRWLRDELAGRGAKGRRETSLAPNSAERDELNARLSPRLEFELALARGKFAWRVMVQCHDGTEVLGAPRYSSEQAARLAASKVKTVSGCGVARGSETITSSARPPIAGGRSCTTSTTGRRVALARSRLEADLPPRERRPIRRGEPGKRDRRGIEVGQPDRGEICE